MPSNRYNTAVAFIEAFDSLSASTFLSLLTPTCQHIFAPASADAPREPLDNNAFAAHISSLTLVLRNFPVYPKEIIENERANQVVVWATSETRFHDEVMDGGIAAEEWKYRGEYIFILSMDESGERIERVVEFVDSKGTDRLRVLMARAKKNREVRAALQIE